MIKSWLMKRMRAVIEYTRCRVKTKSKLANLKINSRIERYNGKKGSNPWRIKEF